MITKLVKKTFGTKNDREVKRLKKLVNQVNQLEEEISGLSDDALASKTAEFKERLSGGETLDQLLPSAFAVVREVSKRVMKMRHFDVQLIGGMVLHSGKISEMRTGEGKTLVATLPAYLNALTGKGVHVVTVTDYLAKRDANWMRPIYEFLGLTVGVVLSGQDHETKKQAYVADITYGTNNEYGFDYLRDNMAFRAEDKVQRYLNFAIIDEVDSILIDEARTPLIISGPSDDSSELYKKINQIIPGLRVHTEETPGDFTIDEKGRNVELTEEGHEHVENLLTDAGLLSSDDSLYAPTNLGLLHHVHAALRAHHVFQKGVDYIVENDEVIIIDEHTGRKMTGRRWSDGLHQAVEAKENAHIQQESQTFASITFQNYFRLYDKLSGMTGTADTEAFEFHQIYGLDVVVIPTHKPMVRKDMNDLIYLTVEEKFEAVIQSIKEAVERKQPVLVGTVSIEISEFLSSLLTKAKIKHSVLNAKFHEKEAEIISQAGMQGAVTIATNMAGRGTDIVLGGSWEAEVANLDNPTADQIENIKSQWRKRNKDVLDAGGLYVIGTERHESRRIDNQLRGRSGRQGDPGMTRFYLSLQDRLMRIFASERIGKLMQVLGMEKGEAIESQMVTKSIEKAQRKVEGHNFDIRKQLLEYDDVANDQRRIIYKQRNELMNSSDISSNIKPMREAVINEVISRFVPPQSFDEQWDIPELEKYLASEFGCQIPIQTWLDEDNNMHEEILRKRIIEQIEAIYKEKEKIVGEENIRSFEKQIMLQVLDTLWKEHLATMDHLRQGIHLRGYAQKNPKQEYKREAFNLFQSLLTNLQQNVIRILSRVEIKQDDLAELQKQQEENERKAKEKMQLEHPKMHAAAQANQDKVGDDKMKPKAQPQRRSQPKVGRNEPCPCGSGKKYKHCHGHIG